ncbi:MAG: helix-turn-helix transcriptional regulator [Rhodobacter sp.]|nr:helix-turn-helix transcriptional regulator [Rhodobacter sp.]MCY4169310.1 helix-turn-helix transcriptional regulator [Rhodobacter sp.]
MSNRTYSRLTRQALALLGARIKLARKERRMSERDLAERIGIARSTLQKIEKGDPRVDIGFVFEAAVLVGQPLFESEATSLVPQLDRVRDKLALMPGKIKKPRTQVIDDF